MEGSAAFDPIEPNPVLAGTPTDLICHSNHHRSISACYYIKPPGFIGDIKIFDGLSQTRYEYVGMGLRNGECGLRLYKVDKNNTGHYKCKLKFDDGSEEVAELDLMVLPPSEEAILRPSNSNSMNSIKEQGNETANRDGSTNHTINATAANEGL